MDIIGESYELKARTEEIIPFRPRKKKIDGKYKIDVRYDWSFIRRGKRE